MPRNAFIQLDFYFACLKSVCFRFSFVIVVVVVIIFGLMHSLFLTIFFSHIQNGCAHTHDHAHAQHCSFIFAKWKSQYQSHIVICISDIATKVLNAWVEQKGELSLLNCLSVDLTHLKTFFYSFASSIQRLIEYKVQFCLKFCHLSRSLPYLSHSFYLFRTVIINMTGIIFLQNDYCRDNSSVLKIFWVWERRWKSNMYKLNI